jgi:hypothetical protein
MKLLKRRLVNLAVKDNTTMKLLAVRYLIVNVVLEEHTTTKKVSQVLEVVNLAMLVHILQLDQSHQPTVKIVPRGSTSKKLLALLIPIVKNAALVNTVVRLRKVQIVQSVPLVDIIMKTHKRRLVNLAVKENTTIKLLAVRCPIVKVVVGEHTTIKKVSQVLEVVNLAMLVHIRQLVQSHQPTVRIVTRVNLLFKLLALRYPIVKIAALVNTVVRLREVQIVQSVPLVDITIKLLERRLVNFAVKENTTIKLLAVQYLIVKVVVGGHTTTKKVSQVLQVVNCAFLVHILQLVQPH